MLKQLEEHMKMVMTFKPDIKRLGILYNAGEANSKALVAGIKELSGKMGFEVVESTAAKTADVFAAAKSLVGRADVVFLGRVALREPAWPQRAAAELGLDWRDAPYPPQYTRGTRD